MKMKHTLTRNQLLVLSLTQQVFDRQQRLAAKRERRAAKQRAMLERLEALAAMQNSAGCTYWGGGGASF